MKEMIQEKLEKVASGFEVYLYESNPNVVKSLKAMGFDDAKIRKTELFDWFQGVGLYGYYKLFDLTHEQKYLDIIIDYFNVRIEDGLPEKNINSMAPMLTLLSILDNCDNDVYESLCLEWAEWLYQSHPRTQYGGLSHMTCEAENSEELWDDTLFMSVLFLAKAGVHFKNENYIEEALYQFTLHEFYLSDRSSNLWYHGWTFENNHNFVQALWARGNAWLTIFIPEILEILSDYDLNQTDKQLKVSYRKQCDALMALQSPAGLWHTLLNDDQTYLEVSGSAGIVYGLIKGVNKGLLPHIEDDVIDRAIRSLLSYVDDQGVVNQVSAGTAMGKDSLDYYRHIPIEAKPYGQALMMLALSEYLVYKGALYE